MENVFMTTTERKRMSTKTTFKRIALVAVAALGLGVLSVAPAAQAALIGETLSVGSATATAYVGDSATTTISHTFGVQAANESSTVTSTCVAPAGASCPTVTFWRTATADTANIGVVSASYPLYVDTAWTDTGTSTSGTAVAPLNVKAVNFTRAGTYTYTFYTKALTAQNSGVATITSLSATWTVTVTARDAAVASGTIYLDSDNKTAEYNRNAWKPASDSAVVVDKGTAGSYSAVAYAIVTVKNAAGDTRTATSTAAANTSGATAINDSVTVTLSGPGALTGIGSVKAKVAYIDVYNGGANNGYKETVVVYSDGTAGTATLTFTSTSTGIALGTKTITFTGAPASASSLWFSDTAVVLGQDSPTVTALVRDSAGNQLATGTVYVFSSDTSVAGVVPTGYPNKGKTSTHSCTIGQYTASLAVCQIPVTDTGVVSITIGDSWTVAASTWTSSALSLTVTGATVKTLTATFDKATYAPGERAVVTLTAVDSAGRAVGTSALSTSQFTVLSTPALSYFTGTNIGGTQSNITSSLDDDFVGFKDSGIETRVVVMPSYGGTVKYALTFATFGSTTGEKTTVTASATVADPTKDAADAATDAALEATDAAYAAQDAAQLAAEAADAATAAAEAATAAVEDLATQVASLFADLQKQITTLANVVAKIAKKVKA